MLSQRGNPNPTCDIVRMMNSSIATNLACIMQDAMDQAKFKCPRVRGQPVSKLWTKLYRPRLHVSGTWLHGRCFYLSVSDEDFCKDAVGEIEQLCRALDDLYCQHGTLPFGLSCHADNTYREFKNRHCIGFLVLITALGIFRWTSASFLRVVHSDLIKPFRTAVVKIYFLHVAIVHRFCSFSDQCGGPHARPRRH